MTVEFTPEELTDLSKLHCLAMHLIRAESSNMGRVPPCWLTLSNETKADVLTRLRKMLQLVNVDLSMADNGVPDDMLASWRDAELRRKQMRADRNPQGWFA